MSISIAPSMVAHSTSICWSGLITRVPPCSIRSSISSRVRIDLSPAVLYLLSKLSACSYLTRAPCGIKSNCSSGHRSVKSHTYSAFAQQKLFLASPQVAVRLLDASNCSGSWIQPENALRDMLLLNVRGWKFSDPGDLQVHQVPQVRQVWYCSAKSIAWKITITSSLVLVFRPWPNDSQEFERSHVDNRRRNGAAQRVSRQITTKVLACIKWVLRSETYIRDTRCRLNKLGGISPESRLLLRSSWVMERKDSNNSGIVPTKLLWDMNRPCNVYISPINEGKSPSNLFIVTSLRKALVLR